MVDGDSDIVGDDVEVIVSVGEGLLVPVFVAVFVAVPDGDSDIVGDDVEVIVSVGEGVVDSVKNPLPI